MRSSPAAWIIGAAALLTGCRKETSRPQWDVDLLGPLLHSTLTIRDLVADSLLSADANGALTLVYSDRIFSVGLDSLLALPDTSIDYGYAWPLGSFNFAAGSYLPGNNDETSLDLEDVQLRRVDLREGTLQMVLRNKIASGIYGTFTLPGAIGPGGALALQGYVPAGSPSSPSVTTQQQNLGGYQFDLTGPQHNTVNTLKTVLNLQLDPNGSGATVTSADSITARLNYLGLVPEYARGYFGHRQVHVGPETSSFGLFDEFLAGTLDVDQVTLRIKITNGVGVDMRMNIGYLTARNNGTGATVPLQHAILNGPINLNRAVDLGGGFQSSVYQNTLDNNNSNVDQMIEVLPDEFEYDLDLELNPLGDISNGNDFLYHDSRIEARAELEIPLNLIATGIKLEQTMDMDLPGSEAGHGLQHGDLMLFATNGFPLQAAITMAIVDGDGNVLSHMPVEGSVASGILGADLLVQASVTSRLKTHLDEAQVDMLYAGGRIRLTAIFDTADQSQHLQLLDSYKLDLQLTARANYIVNGDE